MNRKIILGVSTVIMMASSFVNVYAGEWKQDNIGWWYQNNDGSYSTNLWQWIDGNNDGIAEGYYFGNDGYLLVNTVTPDGYQVNADGAWIVNGVVQCKFITNEMASDNMIEQNWENNYDDTSASTSNGIIFPTAGQTLYYQDRYFYVSSIRMDIIDYYEFIDKYVITYQINGNLSENEVVYAYLDSYSDDGTLLDHRIIGLENDGMNTGEIHIPAKTVRIELVSNKSKSRTSQSSAKRSSQSKNSSKKDTNVKNTNSSSKSNIKNKNTNDIDNSNEIILSKKEIDPEEFLNRLEYESGSMEFSNIEGNGSVNVYNLSFSNPRISTNGNIKLDYSYMWSAELAEGHLSSMGTFNWYGYDDSGKQYVLGFSSWLSTKDGEQKTKSGTLNINPNIIRIEFDANFRH